MAQASNHNPTLVELEDTYKVVYEKRSFLGFISWFVEVKRTSIGRDLVINTMEKFEKIYLNGKELKEVI